jgi:hypothetical protein
MNPTKSTAAPEIYGRMGTRCLPKPTQEYLLSRCQIGTQKDMTVTAHMVEALVELNAVIITGPLSSEMMLVNINIQIETIQMTEVISISHCRTSR